MRLRFPGLRSVAPRPSPALTGGRGRAGWHRPGPRAPGGRTAAQLGLRRRELLSLLDLSAFPATNEKLPWNFGSPGDLELRRLACSFWPLSAVQVYPRLFSTPDYLQIPYVVLLREPRPGSSRPVCQAYDIIYYSDL